MRDIVVTLPQTVDEIKILLLGDVHKGSREFNEELFLDTVELIRTTPNLYAILMGDLIDNALKTSKSDSYLATERPQESMQWIIEKLDPIKDKLLACTNGNHEDRTERDAGMDLTWWLAKSLGIEERYSNGPFILFVSMGKNQGREGVYHTFSIYGMHGVSAGNVKGLQNMGGVVVNADVYVMGHSHKPVMFPEPRIVVDTANKKHKLIDPLFVNGPSFLNFEGSYGEAKGYKPNSQRKLLIKLKTGYATKSTSLEML